MKIGGVTIREVYVRWIGIFVLAYVMTFLHEKDEGQTLLDKYLMSLVFTGVFWNGAFAIFMYFRKVIL